MRDPVSEDTFEAERLPVGPPDDYVLMEAIALRDAAALAELYDRHSGLVFSLCLRVLRDRAEAEDVLIDVFHELWDRCDRYDPARSSPQTYLVLLARSRAIDRVRSRTSQGPPAAGDRDTLLGAAIPSQGPDPLVQAEFSEDQARIVSALRQIDPAQRQAIECSFYEGLSHAQIANRLGKPLGTIKSSIRAGLMKLREMLCEG
jgi:RNA polymerase sigma-70 factor, ECF subfamily